MACFKDLKRLREQAGLSQNKLAARAGVSRDTVSNAERGKNCQPAKLHLILNALNEYYYDQKNTPLDSMKYIKDA